MHASGGIIFFLNRNITSHTGMSHRVARPYLAVPAAARITITCRMYYIQLVPLPIFHRVTVLAYTGSFLFGSFGCTHQNPATTPHPTTTRGRAVLSTIRVTFLRLLKARKAGGRGHEASLPVFFCWMKSFRWTRTRPACACGWLWPRRPRRPLMMMKASPAMTPLWKRRVRLLHPAQAGIQPGADWARGISCLAGARPNRARVGPHRFGFGQDAGGSTRAGLGDFRAGLAGHACHCGCASGGRLRWGWWARRARRARRAFEALDAGRACDGLCA